MSSQLSSVLVLKHDAAGLVNSVSVFHASLSRSHAWAYAHIHRHHFWFPKPRLDLDHTIAIACDPSAWLQLAEPAVSLSWSRPCHQAEKSDFCESSHWEHDSLVLVLVVARKFAELAPSASDWLPCCCPGLLMMSRRGHQNSCHENVQHELVVFQKPIDKECSLLSCQAHCVIDMHVLLPPKVKTRRTAAAVSLWLSQFELPSLWFLFDHEIPQRTEAPLCFSLSTIVEVLQNERLLLDPAGCMLEHHNGESKNHGFLQQLPDQCSFDSPGQNAQTENEDIANERLHQSSWGNAWPCHLLETPHCQSPRFPTVSLTFPKKQSHAAVPYATLDNHRKTAFLPSPKLQDVPHGAVGSQLKQYLMGVLFCGAACPRVFVTPFSHSL